MTSHRATQTSWRSVRFACVAIVSASLGACAALPDDAPVVEQLDTETGVTVARLGKPVELYRETFLQDPSGRFAFLGPFETNLMGKRELFLWIAVPAEPMADAVPAVEIDGKALTLGVPGRAADFAGLHKSPYKIPTPWSAMYYFRIEESMVRQLADATRLAIGVLEPTKSGTVKTTFAAGIEADTRLKEFAAR
jgi:hypothetical protein